MAFPPSLLIPIQNAPPINPIQRAKLSHAAPSADLPPAFSWQSNSDIVARSKVLNKPLLPGANPFRLSDVVNQATCGNCWACSSATAMTDRLNVLKNVNHDPAFSGWDGRPLSITWLASCDRACASAGNLLSCANGCNGADVGTALRFLTQDASGGFASIDCLPQLDLPYIEEHRKQFPKLSQCELSKGNCGKYQEECNICTDGTPMTSNVFVKEGSVVRHISAEEIKQDIYAYGPLVGTFQVLDDFQTQSPIGQPAFVDNGGVYIEGTDAKFKGFHAVVIVGWGHEQVRGTDIPYWIVRNSWSSQWATGGYWKHAMQDDSKNINMRSGLEGVAVLADGDAPSWLGAAGGSISFDVELRGSTRPSTLGHHNVTKVNSPPMSPGGVSGGVYAIGGGVILLVLIWFMFLRK